MHELAAGLAALAGRIEPAWLVPLAAVVFAHFLAEPLRWRTYLRARTTGTLMRIFSLAALVGYALPAKLGLPLRIVLLRRHFPLPLATVSALLVLDGVLYYGAWAAAALIGLPWAAANGWKPDGAWILAAVLLLAMSAAAVGLACRPQRLPASIRSRLHRLIVRHAEGVRIAVSMIDRRALGSAAAVNALDVLGHTLRHGVLLALIGQSLSAPELFAITSLSIFAGLVSMMPMGLGGYDLTLIFLLKLHGIPVADALSVALANRAANLAMSLSLGSWAGAGLGLGALNRGSLARIAAEAPPATGPDSQDSR